MILKSIITQLQKLKNTKVVPIVEYHTTYTFDAITTKN